MQPFGQLYVVNLVTVLPYVLPDFYDVSQRESVGYYGLCGLYDDVEHIERLYGCVLRERFVLTDAHQLTVEPSVAQV